MTVSEINAVVTETRIAATPETVFAFFVDPTKMVRWMGSRAEADPRPGGTYALDINAQARARGEFIEVVPYSRVVFTFGWEADHAVPPGSSTVEVTLTPDGDGTHVRLIHRGIMTTEMREQHSLGWQHYLARLSVSAGGGEPGPDPNAHSATEQVICSPFGAAIANSNREATSLPLVMRPSKRVSRCAWRNCPVNPTNSALPRARCTGPSKTTSSVTRSCHSSLWASNAE